LFRDGAGEFLGWYVNLEAPHLRDEANVYSEDHILDVLVQPNHECVRKDADELALAVQQERLSRAQADAIVSSADAVEAIVAAWGSPFCDGWERWSEKPDWRPLDLPKEARWDVDFSDR
jgi:predicted RNA-binding protein associated with RNAse of E/G family